MSYVGLHNHTEASNVTTGLDCINKLDDFVQAAINIGLKGVAITDHDNLSLVADINKLQKKLLNDKVDFKLIYGNEIYLVDEFEKGNEFDLKRKYWHFILVAKDKIGYDAIVELSSRAWYRSEIRRGKRRVPTLKSDLEEIISKAKGHIVGCTACLGSQFDRLVLDGDKEGALKFVNWCRNLFGENDFFIELQPSKSDDQIKFNRRAIQFADDDFRFIISTDSHYQKMEDFPLFEAFLRSQQEKREVQEYYEYARLQSEEEVRSLLDYLPSDFIDQALANTLEVGEQVEFFDLNQTEVIPSSPIDKSYQLVISDEEFNMVLQYSEIKRALESSETPTLYCAKFCLNSLSERDLFKKEYLDQLNEEFDVFFYQSERLHSNFFSYFRCVQYIIELAWSIDCAVGPSRGSAGGCLTTFLMNITQEDPLQHQLFFWRFINKERIELPDVDFDLAPSKREQLFAKIREDRGELGLLQVATFKTLTLKAAIGNAGRGYRSEDCPNGLDPDTIGYLSSLIQIYRGGVATLKQTLEGDEEKGFTKNHSFIKECEQYPGLLDIIKKIEGLIVNSSTHASAIILFDDKDTILTHGSVMRAPNGALCTATELYSSSYLGMVKLDALLLSTLDCQSTCFKLLQKDKIIDDKLTLRECYQKYIDVNKIDYDNPLIWQKLYDNSVLSVFQFDQPSGRKGILATAPKSLEQMTCLNGAIRLITPEGEEDQIERFAKYGKNIELFEDELNKHKIPEDMKQIIHRELDKTNGCCLAQETLMTLCMELANFTMGEANTIRKVLAKKKVNQIAEQEQLFASRLKDRLTESQAKYLWRTFIKPQMNYSFCRAHGLGYSMVGVQCILLGGVLFPPIYWQTACLLQRSGALDDKAADYNKIAKAVSIISKQGVNIAPLNINKSENEFRLDAENNTIYFGFGGVKGLKEKVIEAILTYRPFENLQDFISKCNPDVTSLVCLTKAGAFDNFGLRRDIINKIAELKCGTKLRLNGQNLLMLSRENLWPQETEELKFAQRLFNFTQYLKQQLPKTKEERELFTAYKIDSRARHYLEDVGYDNLIEVIGEEDYLNKETWKAVYDVEMNIIKQYLIDNQEGMLNKVNSKAKQDWLKKYFPNNDFAQWEIETMGLCFGEHPMRKVIEHYNNDGNPKSPKFADFEQLSQEPEPAYFFEKNGKKIPMYDLYMICGIVIAKDKIKGMITLLTPTGPVDVKFGKNRFANYDKQISKIVNGKKTVVEKSWFNRGEKVMIHGRRQDDLYMAKTYRNSPMKHTVYKITEIGDDGRIQIQQERKTGMMEESDEND